MICVLVITGILVAYLLHRVAERFLTELTPTNELRPVAATILWTFRIASIPAYVTCILGVAAVAVCVIGLTVPFALSYLYVYEPIKYLGAPKTCCRSGCDGCPWGQLSLCTHRWDEFVPNRRPRVDGKVHYVFHTQYHKTKEEL